MAEMVSPENKRANFEKQLDDLKNQVRSLSKSLADRGSRVLDSVEEAASDAVDGANSLASGRLKLVRQQVGVVADTVRENPGTAATVLSSAGFLLGLSVRLIVASNSQR